MIKLAIFHLDGVIVSDNNSIFYYVEEYLQKIEQENIKVMFISEKPAAYIAGLLENLKLKDAIICGENGGDIYYNANLPIKKRYTYEYSTKDSEMLKEFKNKLIKEFSNDISIQPNIVNFNIFIKSYNNHKKIQKEIKEFIQHNSNFDFKVKNEFYYRIFPKEVTSEFSIKMIMRDMNIKENEVIFITNDESHQSIFDFIEYSIGINIGEAKYSVNYTLEGLNKAVEIINDKNNTKIHIMNIFSTKDKDKLENFLYEKRKEKHFKNRQDIEKSHKEINRIFNNILKNIDKI